MGNGDISNLDKIILEDISTYIKTYSQKNINEIINKPINVKSIKLKQFGALYCKILNNIYKNFKCSKPIEISSHICYPFFYKTKPEILLKINNIIKFENDLIKIYNKKMKINKSIRVYDKDLIYIIKPKQLKYWLQSNAINDAFETFGDLVKQGF